MTLRLYYLLFCISMCASGAQAAPFWSYDGTQDGQSDWHELSPEYGKCGIGNQQSPVSITRTTEDALPPLQFNYTSAPAELTLDRYTIVTSPTTRLQVTEGTSAHVLKEMLLRTPSEHDIKDAFAPLEIQFVHMMPGQKLLIVAVLVKEGAPNPALQSIIDHAPTARKEVKPATVDWNMLLPASRGYYSYTGSLSYPPCTEEVKWRVLKNPVTASYAQLRQIAEKLGRNARGAQPLMNRTIFESKE